MKISFITTVYNEEKTIERFLDSLMVQSKKPDEVIIVDGGSKDDTLSKISNFKFLISNKKVKILTKRGNRSIGRNEAIRKATGDIILCSDAGNILDKNWVKNITDPFFKDPSTSLRMTSGVDVVAGYYQGLAKNIFQKCVTPYALVMPDKVNPDTFLPATRSIAFTKAIWKKVGGFNEKLSHNEDYAFAKKLKKIVANIVFKKNAIVYWLPRNTFKEAFIMFFRFAYGDAEAKIFRPKVALVFFRYLVALFIVFSLLSQAFLLLGFCLLLLIVYSMWSILKNYRYVNDWRAIFYLPALQVTADAAVISGTLLGIISLWGTQNRR